MITNPKTFFEQFQNFIEESGLHLKKLKSNLSNYFTKSEAIDTFLGKTDKATSAITADTATSATSAVNATKATQDASGNVITTTYATKSEVNTGLAGKANSSHTHTIANVTGLQDALNAASTQASNAIPKAGNRGALKGFENSTAGTTVNDASPDTQHTGSNVTVQNGTANATTSWTKVVDMTAGTVTLGSSWVWSGGKAPTLKYPGVLTCHWNGGNRKGIAIYTAGAS